jgi:hypothetical protein
VNRNKQFFASVAAESVNANRDGKEIDSQEPHIIVAYEFVRSEIFAVELAHSFYPLFPQSLGEVNFALTPVYLFQAFSQVVLDRAEIGSDQHLRWFPRWAIRW